MKTNHVLLHALFFLLASILSTCVYAQHENNIWKFGFNYGLDFSSGNPVAGTSSMQSLEGCASVCDGTGKLLFYSNGNNIWDKNNNVMPNGSGIIGNQAAFWGISGSATQGVAIVRSLSNPLQYYLFVLDAFEQLNIIVDTNGSCLRYSLIDMSLNNGLGDVVPGQKNIILDSSLSEKMTVTTGNNCNYWLLTHHRTETQYKAFKIDMNGINTTPVISNTGVVSGSSFIYESGEMKISPDKSMVATISTAAKIELATFDATTGIVSNAVLVDYPNSMDTVWGILYGIEFSPDNSRLYTGTMLGSHAGGVSQYDLTLLPNITAVKNSKIIIDTGDFAGLRTGPDGKIYVARSMTPFIACINNPNALGTACNLVPNSIPVPLAFPSQPYFGYTLGNPVVILPVDTSYNATDTSVCKITATINAPSGYSAYLWSDGSVQQSDTLHVPGTKWVYAFNNCDVLIDTFRITSKISDTAYSHTDTAVCFSTAVSLTATLGYEQYLWNDGSSQQTDIVHQTSLNWCISNKECHFQIDTFNVSITNFSAALGNDTSICHSDTIAYHFGMPGAQYLWSDASADSLFDITGPGKYWVTIRDNSCEASDTINITNKILQVSLGNDTTLCNNKQLLLTCNIDGAYLWQDNSTGKDFPVTAPGQYWLQVSQGNCYASDTINVNYEICDCQAFVPTAFTPNDDGKNDLFGAHIDCNFTGYRMRVFNRWGQLVFDSFSINDKWNGFYKGRAADIGSYFYSLTFTGPKGNSYFYKGDVILVR
jgi:gliding motility-associated-like protein